MNATAPKRLSLPRVTLVAATSVNLSATIAALERSMRDVSFGAAKLLTDRSPAWLPEGLEHVQISPLTSGRGYSNFMIHELAEYVQTSHCLVVQWDGWVLDPARWNRAYLEYDFIGARWPQFGDGHDVGNGGFSLRSRALLDACRDPAFRPLHPEDLAICRHNRTWLEERGLRFAPSAIADTFAAERGGVRSASFGFHGVWHMPDIVGPEQFWDIYRNLDDRTNVRHDYRTLLSQLACGKGGLKRAAGLTFDQVSNHTRKRNFTR